MWRSYPSVEDSYRDHAEFRSFVARYDLLFAYSTDYKEPARGLRAAGYATAPDYAQRLIRIIEGNGSALLDRPNGNRLYSFVQTADSSSGKSHVRIAGPSGGFRRLSTRRLSCDQQCAQRIQGLFW